jgi:hypothetical protein
LCFIRSGENPFVIIFCIFAEVVELADTPSEAITLAILYKLLILQLLHFTSITYKGPPKSAQ